MISKGMTVAQIAHFLEQSTQISEETICLLKQDSRVSVIQLLRKWDKARIHSAEEQKRIRQMYKYEQQFYDTGCQLIAGVDEAGRGPLAGPLVVAAVILPMNSYIPLLNDSKKLNPKQREEVYHSIQKIALAIQYCIIDVAVIDAINIFQATVQGMYRVITELSPAPEAVLIDAVGLPELKTPCLSLIGGDGLSASIAAASIIAKVERDRIMTEMEKQYPLYGFENHKGYGTPEHLEALRLHGPCPIHRKSFEPVKTGRFKL